jgi:hypothetical protein
MYRLGIRHIAIITAHPKRAARNPHHACGRRAGRWRLIDAGLRSTGRIRRFGCRVVVLIGDGYGWALRRTRRAQEATRSAEQKNEQSHSSFKFKRCCFVEIANSRCIIPFRVAIVQAQTPNKRARRSDLSDYLHYLFAL